MVLYVHIHLPTCKYIYIFTLIYIYIYNSIIYIHTHILIDIFVYLYASYRSKSNRATKFKDDRFSRGSSCLETPVSPLVKLEQKPTENDRQK